MNFLVFLSISQKRDEKIDELHQLHNVTKQRLDESVGAIESTRGYEDKYRKSQSRIEKLEEKVRVERQTSQAKLDKMSKIESLLDSLKARAAEADKMEQELTRLKNELSRIKDGKVTASGDDDWIHPTASDSCNSCQKLLLQLHNIQEKLQHEVYKSREIQVELNFLRERARTFEVVEAELHFYKVRARSFILPQWLVFAISS